MARGGGRRREVERLAGQDEDVRLRDRRILLLISATFLFISAYSFVNLGDSFVNLGELYLQRHAAVAQLYGRRVPVRHVVG